MNNILASVKSWLKKPFDSQGSALNWILFLGLVIIAAFAWNTVLLKIKD